MKFRVTIYMRDGSTYSGIWEHYSQTGLQSEYLARINRWEKKHLFQGLRVVPVEKKESLPDFQQTFEWGRVRKEIEKRK